MYDLTPTNLEQLVGNPSAFWGLIFLFALVDSTFLVGIFLSGIGTFSVSMFALLGGYVTIPEIAVCAFGGAVIGDHVSFLIGKRFGQRGLEFTGNLVVQLQRRRNRSPFLRIIVPKKEFTVLIEKAKWGIREGGAAFLVIGRWLPIASLIPATCSALAMPYRKFAFLNCIACTLWVAGWCCVMWLIEQGLLVSPVKLSTLR